MSLNGSINLLKLPGARKIIAKEQKGIFIPVDENPSIFVGEKGAYLSIRVVEKESEYEDRHYTHFVSASLQKKDREKLEAAGYSKEDIYKLTPILGNLETYEPQPGNGGDYEEEEVKDDLPF